MAFNYAIRFNAVDNVTRVANRVDGSINRVSRSAGQMSQSIRSRLVTARRAVDGFGTRAVAGGIALTMALKNTLTAYQDIAKAQGEVASLGVGTKAMQNLTKYAKRL